MMGKVVFLGVEGSGKTVLTSALVSRFKSYDDAGWYLKPASQDSFRFVEQLPSLDDGGELPHQTTQCRRLEWHVKFGRETVRDISILDYPGEVYRYSFLDENDAEDPELFREKRDGYKKEIKTLLKHLTEADTVFVLFNLADARNLARNSKNLDAVWITHACLDYLERLPSSPKVLFVLTQIDRYVKSTKTAVDVTELVHKKVPLVWQNHPELEMLAISSFAEGDTLYGIDHLIERWFADAPMVQQCNEKLVAAAEGVSNSISSFCEHPDSGTEQISNAVLAYVSAFGEMPWFVDCRTVLEEKYLSQNACEDILSIVEQIGDVPKLGSDESAINDFIRRTSVIEIGRSSENGQTIVEACRDWAKALRSAWKNNIDTRKRWKKTLFVVCVLVTVILLGVCYVADCRRNEAVAREQAQWEADRKKKEEAREKARIAAERRAEAERVEAERQAKAAAEAEREQELKERRGYVFRALIMGKEVNAVLRTSVGMEYQLPRQEKGLERKETIRGGVITAVVNDSVYSRRVADTIVDWEGENHLSVELSFVRRSNAHDGPGDWVEGLPHPTAKHWISSKNRGKWMPESGYRERNPRAAGLSELVKKEDELDKLLQELQ